jgi:hypothetical protein
MAWDATDWASAVLRAATFLLAIFAALVAGQLYTLARSGEVGRTWRPFIPAALVFAAWAVMMFAQTFFAQLFESGRALGLVMDGLLTCFVLLFASGLWQARQVYYRPEQYRPLTDDGLDEFGRPRPPEDTPERAEPGRDEAERSVSGNDQ